MVGDTAASMRALAWELPSVLLDLLGSSEEELSGFGQLSVLEGAWSTGPAGVAPWESGWVKIPPTVSSYPYLCATFGMVEQK